MKSLVATAWTVGSLTAIAFAVTSHSSSGAPPTDAPVPFQVRLDRGHPWRPPFGLDRVGRPIAAVIDTNARPGPAVHIIEAYFHGKQVGRQELHFAEQPPYSARAVFDGAVTADFLVLLVKTSEAPEPIELARHAIQLPEFEAAAVAKPDAVINPVDLGTILVPADWLLLGPAQTGTLEIAAMSRTRDLPGAKMKVWFDSAPTRAVAGQLPLHAGERARLTLKLPDTPPAGDRDVLSVAVEDGAGKELWRKAVPVMLVRDPPRRPRFGATYERLRYDAPISVREPGTGKFSSMPYENGWNPELRDVVVWLPNGGRFVFWRGSSYIPFWAGVHNTGACYEWAEIISQPQGAVDCVEPLMDKELRYGRVEIVESTSARVHVRWTYQSTDFNYKVWGDEAIEDYYFYPDGFGTRALSLKSDPKNDYELSEFIIITPQGAYPFDVLPDDPVDALFLDGKTHQFRFPNSTADKSALNKHDKQGLAAIYRLRFAKDEKLSAISFNPYLTRLPPVIFGPFFDGGQMVSPCYWGSHWPLARGNSTGRTIDDRIALTPTHNSVMSWAGTRPAPIYTSERVTLDTLHRSRVMTLRRWAWLIGLSDAADGRLIDWAKSYASSPSLEVHGARFRSTGYASERRAIHLGAIAGDVLISIKPTAWWVNPVFEFTDAPKGSARVTLGGQVLESDRFAWDGRNLWLNATIKTPTELGLSFLEPMSVR